MTRSRAAALALAAALLAAGIGAWRLSRTPPSDEELVRALFDRAARAAEEKRAGDAVADVSERFRGQGLDRRELQRFVAFQSLRGEWNAIAILGSRVEVAGDGARAVVDAAFVRSGKGQALADRLPAAGSTWRIEASLEREGGRWRVTEAAWRPVPVEDAAAGTGR